jgi:hypothetical protein
MSNSSGDPGPLIRPYALTGGRTESRAPSLAMEDLVSVIGAGEQSIHMSPQFDEQHHAIVAACREPISVAEVSAHLGLPLGVTQVLLGDLVAAGVLKAHRSADNQREDGRPSLELLGRVLERLQAM